MGADLWLEPAPEERAELGRFVAALKARREKKRMTVAETCGNHIKALGGRGAETAHMGGARHFARRLTAAFGTKASDARVMRAWLTLGVFAGLRPIEVARLHWEDIDWDKGTIFVRPQTAKQVRAANTEGRFVTISDALRAWLGPVAAGKRGSVMPVKSKAMLHYKGLMEKSAGVDIPADALRHSYATYRYALDGDATATARELGHASTDITFRHYARRDVTKQDAEAWFGIRSPGRARNVIPMRGAGREWRRSPT